MKFRMAERSLFAILLRSHWSISLLLAAGFVAVSRALLPEQYWLFGAMGGMPFWVIAAMAAWRQRHRLPPARVEALLGMASGMGWKDFSQALAAGFARSGWAVQPLTQASEGGADFVLRRNAVTAVVAARRFKAARVGEEPLRQLAASRDAHAASQCLLITLTPVTAPTSALASSLGVQIVQGEPLAQLLQHLTPAG